MTCRDADTSSFICVYTILIVEIGSIGEEGGYICVCLCSFVCMCLYQPIPIPIYS